MNRKKHLIAAFILFFICASVANNTTDSLKLVLKEAKNDSVKIKIITDLAWRLYKQGNYDEALNYCQVLANTSERIEDFKGAGNAYIISGQVYQDKNDYETAVNHYSKSIELFTRGKIEAGITRANEHIARCYDKFGKHDLAIIHFKKAIIEAAKRKDTIHMAASFNFIGGSYHNLGRYPEALEAYLRELDLCQKMNDLRGEFFCYNNIAVLYKGQNKTDDALKYHEKALKAAIGYGDSAYIAGSLFNIGSLYYVTNDYKKALEYNNRALTIYESINEIEGMSDCYSNRGSINEVNGHEKEALEDYRKAYDIYNSVDYPYGIIKSGLSIGNLLVKQNKLAEGKKYLDMSLDLAQKKDFIEELKECYDAFSKYYAATGNYKEAFEFYKKYTSTKDSIESKSSTEKMIKQQVGYEFDKKEEQLRSENEKVIARSEEEKRRQNIITASISIGFVLVLILAIVIYRSLRLNRNKNKIITEQKKLVEEKQKEIVDSIRYARRIQQSLMPTEKYIDKNLRKPKYLQ